MEYERKIELQLSMSLFFVLEHPLTLKSHMKTQGLEYDHILEAQYGPDKIEYHGYVKKDCAGGMLKSWRTDGGCQLTPRRQQQEPGRRGPAQQRRCAAAAQTPWVSAVQGSLLPSPPVAAYVALRDADRAS
ncbi:uncharacterized protein LOC124371707 [Homalodisca vitripennis]|uniref:uncharacterized protein LOC124371707 n=1 Tax=Homalodisca vitripennis TaxID=197043 RepID=UPI001EEAC391|nr:uncharacterized protein LOC124371707 [Homalodisca vitripennis]